MTPAEAISSVLASHPDLVNWAVGVYIAGAFAGHVMRFGWPDEPSRPRWVMVTIAIADAAQLVFFSPVKNLARKL